MITVKNKGKFKKLTSFLNRSRKISKNLDPDFIGDKFVKALRDATPVDSGLTAESWKYEVINDDNGTNVQIVIKNTNIQNGYNVAILLNYGHVSSSGTWVEGAHFLEPTLMDLYKSVINNTWKEIENL